ncbi:MAG: glycosyltransferase [Actinomycetota bacterium]
MTFAEFLTWRRIPQDSPLLSVVIPAYNEAERIVPTIASIAAHLCSSDVSFEIIVSDDGSSDGTPELCRELGLRNLIVLDPGVNQGKGAAVRTGVAASSGDLVLFTDADLSTPIEEIDAMISASFEADVVIGSRGTDDADEGEKSAIRTAVSGACRAITRRTLGLDIADTQCGFKLFRREAARRLFMSQRIDGFSFDAEILFLASRFDLRVAEHGVRWFDAPGSKVSPLTESFRFLRDLMMIRFSWLRGVYKPATVPFAERPVHVGVVTALPPSTASLNEYGAHLVEGIRTCEEVERLTVFAEDGDGIPELDGVDVVPAWTFDSVWNLPRLVTTVRRSRPDAVLFNIHFTSFAQGRVAAALGLFAPMALRLLGVPTVVLLHNLVDTTDLDAAGYSGSRVEKWVLTKIGRTLTRFILQADHVVTTMPDYVDVLRDSYGADNVSLTPHGTFETPGFAPTDGASPTLLAFGKFGTYKRVDDLIDAYRNLIGDPAMADVELVIAGTDAAPAPGYLDEMAAKAADLPGVRFTGYVAEEDVAPLFQNATAVVFPYTGTTGSSGPLHQAGAYSRAVVAPRLGDFIGLIEEEGYAAVPFEPADVDSLTDAIRTVLTDHELRDDHARRNHAAANGLPLADIAAWHVLHLQRVAA